MSSGDENAEEANGEVARLFAEYLARRKSGKGADFDSFVQAHPEHARALRIFNSLHAQTVELVSSESFAELVQRELGGNVADPVCLDPKVETVPAEPPGPGSQSTIATVSGKRRYSLRGELGHGGMGIVFKVWDEDLNRPLAMKVLRERKSAASNRPAAGVQQESLTRFLEEAQVTGQLDHPGVVPVHEIGVDGDGHLYFTMQLVKGRELREIFELSRREEGRWTLTRAIGVLVKVCETLAFAHSKGVIHRDLKPANIMVGRFGETYVMDWGLARVLGRTDVHNLRFKTVEDGPDGTESLVHTERSRAAASDPHSPLMTVDGTVLGTPVYMPPEQAEGRVEQLDPRSDVYSVGAMLYELLSGRPPHVRPGKRMAPHAVLNAVIKGPPEPIRKIDPHASPELAAICERAMARSMSDRYPSTRELGEDLQAYLDNRVVRAYQTGAAAEFKKWVLRNKGMAAAIAGSIVLAIAGLLTIIILQAQAREELLLHTDVYVQRGLQDRADNDLWPAHPERILEMEMWLQQSEELAARLEIHKRRLAQLRKRALPYDAKMRQADRENHPRARELEHARRQEGFGKEDLVALEAAVAARTTWKFVETEDQLEHDSLVALVKGLEQFVEPVSGTIAEVRGRLDFARRVRRRTIEEHQERWDRSIRSIANREECPQYGGLRISEQLGLVPVGRDPKSGLWEFAHFQTGKIPERGEDGVLQITEETAIVVVLLPGGTFNMGAERVGTTNVDPSAESREGPVHAVTLTPFFMSKYEMTQGQWQRFTKKNPSYYHPERTSIQGVVFTLKHPVGRVSWHMCSKELPRMGLTLPTEAQWEYAARAGTATPWWTGDAKESLAEGQAANIADKTFKKRTRFAWAVDWLDDGHVVHSPVDEFRANPFGLHNVYGNVWEWCRDVYSADAYRFPTRSGDGERLIVDAGLRSDRGGSYSNTEKKARSAHRQERTPGTNDVDCGVRPARVLTE